jgi:RecB family exonuclease
MKYQFQYAWGVRGGAHAKMTFGNVMHTTIKEAAKALRERGKMPVEEVLAIYDREWRSAGFLDDYHEEEYRREGRRELEDFWKTYSGEPPEVLFQEKPFELPLENDVVITGRMDQINRLGGGRVEIVDYKTGQPKDAKKVAKDFQLSIYALAAKEVLGLDPARLVLYYLATNEAIETTRDAKALKEAREKIAEVAGRIRALDFPAAPGFGCRYCDYRPLCPEHEQLIPIHMAPAKGGARD